MVAARQLACGACVLSELTLGNTRIEFRFGKRHFRPRLKKSVGLNGGVCRHPWGLFPSVRNTYPPLWRIFLGAYAWSWLVGSVATGIFTWAALFFRWRSSCGGCRDYWKKGCVYENIFLGETKWARVENYTSVRIFTYIYRGVYIYVCVYFSFRRNEISKAWESDT